MESNNADSAQFLNGATMRLSNKKPPDLFRLILSRYLMNKLFQQNPLGQRLFFVKQQLQAGGTVFMNFDA